MGTIFTILGCAAAALLGEVTASCLARVFIARFTRGHSVTAPDGGLLLPELSGAGLLAVLALLGVKPLLCGLGALLLLAAAFLPLANVMRLARKQGKADIAGKRIRQVLRAVLQFARYLPARDLNALLGLARGVRPAQGDDGGPGGGYRPVPGGRIRTIPPVTQDVALGPVPPPGAVSDYLDLQGIAVPPAAAAWAEQVATFEEDDVDDWRTWWLEQAAGILTVAAAFHEQGELAGAVRGLDPAVIAAIADFSDIYADVSPAAIMVIRRHDDTYQAVDDHVDSGGTLPEDAAGRWNARGADSQGGQAA